MAYQRNYAYHQQSQMQQDAYNYYNYTPYPGQGYQLLGFVHGYQDMNYYMQWQNYYQNQHQMAPGAGVCHETTRRIPRDNQYHTNSTNMCRNTKTCGNTPVNYVQSEKPTDGVNSTNVRNEITPNSVHYNSGYSEHVSKSLRKCDILSELYDLVKDTQAPLRPLDKYTNVFLTSERRGCDTISEHFIQVSEYPEVCPAPSVINTIFANLEENKCLYPCKECDKQFKSYTAMKMHVLKDHKKETDKFTCPYCQRVFSHKLSCKSHIRIHTGERPYECKFEGCGKSFSHRSSYRKHVRIHTNDKPFKCLVCGRCFGQSSNMQRHWRNVCLRISRSKNEVYD